LKALLRGLFEGPGADPDLRSELEAEADRLGDEALHARLARADPATAIRLHPRDRRRIVRALEVLAATGRPLSDLQREHDRPAEGVCVLALERPRAELHARINRRVDQMFAEGLVEEVRGLQAGPRPLGTVPAQAVGYKEVLELLAGRATLDETIDRVKARTRQFAKRQATWFRGLAEVRAWPVAPDEPAGAIAERLAEVASGPLAPSAGRGLG
jgi:tRNA dimethylallyltransferase